MFDNIYHNRRVLVTGHTGFKGAWLSLWLNHLGADVIGYALEPPTEPSLFELCNLKSKMISVEGDVRDFEQFKKTITEHRPEIIFHMAAQSLVRPSYLDPIETYSTNVMGTVHLLEAVRQTDAVKVIVNITSDKCYENKEWVWGYRENDRMGGFDPYSNSKGCSELITNAYFQSFFNTDESKVALASARAGNVIGGGDWAQARLVPDCIKAFIEGKPLIIRYPEATRPWQHVFEPLAGYLLLAKALYQGGSELAGGWNFGPDDDDVKPVKWIVDRLAKVWGDDSHWEVAGDVQPHEARFLKLDCSKAKSRLGWSPQWNLEIGLEKTAEWYKAYHNDEDLLNLSLDQIISYESTFQNG